MREKIIYLQTCSCGLCEVKLYCVSQLKQSLLKKGNNVLASETPRCLTLKTNNLKLAVLLSGTIYFSISCKIKLGILENWFGAHLWEKRLKRWRAGMGRDGTGRDGTGLESFWVSGRAELLCEYLQILRLFSSRKRPCFEIVWSQVSCTSR